MKPNRYREFMIEEQRLAMLRILSELPGYTANTSVLHTLLTNLAHVLSRDELRTQVAWLDEQGLVEAEPIDGVDGVLFVRLVERGGDVAQGRATVPGVKKPEPR